ncbi:MAG: M50 family metallopeptidase [Kiritimatiellia bacterium]
MVSRNGAFHLFTFRGIEVFVHWSWFIAAVFLMQHPVGKYGSDAYLWSVIEYVGLFGMVLLHEFGHALACKQVGGQAHEIILWPLGGVAFVSPPQRPGATLWSIAAGPLVNVVLVPVLLVLAWAMETCGWDRMSPNAGEMLRSIIRINYMLLIFNLMPVYPLDGGQILRSLLWFVFGRARSLLVASIIGLVGVAGLIILAVFAKDLWLGFIAVFVLLNCWQGLRQALAMARVDDAPMRFGYACPSCHTAPRVGKFWGCSFCHTAFDTFETRAQCPKCGASFSSTRCTTCGVSYSLQDWITVRPPPPPPPSPLP